MFFFSSFKLLFFLAFIVLLNNSGNREEGRIEWFVIYFLLFFEFIHQIIFQQLQTSEKKWNSTDEWHTKIDFHCFASLFLSFFLSSFLVLSISMEMKLAWNSWELMAICLEQLIIWILLLKDKFFVIYKSTN